MTNQTAGTPREELMGLLSRLVHDSEALLGQQAALLRSEARQELGKATEAAVLLGGGAGLLAAGGVLSVAALVHLIHRSTRLPLGACYALVAAGLAAGGAGLLARGRRAATSVRPDLPQSTAALKENLAWLKAQLTTAP